MNPVESHRDGMPHVQYLLSGLPSSCDGLIPVPILVCRQPCPCWDLARPDTCNVTSMDTGLLPASCENGPKPVSDSLDQAVEAYVCPAGHPGVIVSWSFLRSSLRCFPLCLELSAGSFDPGARLGHVWFDHCDILRLIELAVLMLALPEVIGKLHMSWSIAVCRGLRETWGDPHLLPTQPGPCPVSGSCQIFPVDHKYELACLSSESVGSFFVATRLDRRTTRGVF